MVLSSNWLELQKKCGDVKVRRTKSAKSSKKFDKNVSKGRREPARVMQVVHSMNAAIKQVEDDKKRGKILQAESLCRLDKDLSNTKTTGIGKYIAMDSEFVGVGPRGREDTLARVSIVNYNGYVIMDEYVRPRERVVDWRTCISGIEPKHMRIAIDYKDAQRKVADILLNRVLVGHAIAHDLSALEIKHPKSMIRDTSLYPLFRKSYAGGKTPSLKKLAKNVLDVNIQEAEHSSIEDARITMLLYKSQKKEIDRFHRIKIDDNN